MTTITSRKELHDLLLQAVPAYKSFCESNGLGDKIPYKYIDDSFAWIVVEGMELPDGMPCEENPNQNHGIDCEDNSVWFCCELNRILFAQENYYVKGTVLGETALVVKSALDLAKGVDWREVEAEYEKQTEALHEARHQRWLEHEEKERPVREQLRELIRQQLKRESVASADKLVDTDGFLSDVIFGIWKWFSSTDTLKVLIQACQPDNRTQLESLVKQLYADRNLDDAERRLRQD